MTRSTATPNVVAAMPLAAREFRESGGEIYIPEITASQRLADAALPAVAASANSSSDEGGQARESDSGLPTERDLAVVFEIFSGTPVLEEKPDATS